jgi:hypothetical protein
MTVVLGLAWSPNRELGRRLFLLGERTDACEGPYSRVSRTSSEGLRDAIVRWDKLAKAASGS